MVKFSERLSELMQENNLNSTQLSEKISITTSTINTWKNGKHGIQLNNLVALCKVFSCSLEYLSGRKDVDWKPKKFALENFGKQVRKVLDAKGITTYRMRDETRFDGGYLYDWDKGSQPKLNTLVDLANYFECTLDELVGIE